MGLAVPGSLATSAIVREAAEHFNKMTTALFSWVQPVPESTRRTACLAVLPGASSVTRAFLPVPALQTLKPPPHPRGILFCFATIAIDIVPRASAVRARRGTAYAASSPPVDEQNDPRALSGLVGMQSEVDFQ